MTPEQLKDILAKHKLWLEGEGGERANLTDANLYGANLYGANLTDANLYGANLRGANLTGADLTDATLTGANLTAANLRDANLRDANLRGANLTDADLYGANLRGATLTGANLYGANLTDATLTGADLYGANLTDATLTGADLPHFQLVPEVGPFIGWKKVMRISSVGAAVLKLAFSPEVKRASSLVGRKCRANQATPVAAYSPDGREIKGEVFRSMHDPKFTYEVGKRVEVPDYDDDVRVECTRGIHFFITRKEAEEYGV